jgi:hypothetical protein
MFGRTALLSASTLLAVLLNVSPAAAAPAPSQPPSQSALTPLPAEVAFGAVDIHFGGSPRQSVQLSNGSAASVTVTAVAVTQAGVSQAGASHFEIVNDGCSNQTLEPAESCAVEVEFKPGERGEQHAVLELSTAEATLEVPLSGSGLTGTLSAGPSPVSFAAIPYTQGQREESQSETEQVNVLDSQDAGTQIESVSLTGPDASSFSIQYGNCVNAQLHPGNSCDAGIRFQPLSPGPKHAQLVLQSDASNGPITVPLEGEGLLGPRIALDSSEAQLGNISLGLAAEHTFTIANSGDYPLFIQQSFLVSGTPLMFPMLSDTCSGKIVEPASSCAFTVGFHPTTAGEKDASIIFITNASPQINVLGIDGVGVESVLAAQPSSQVLALQTTQAPLARTQPRRPRTTPSRLLQLEGTPRLRRSVSEQTLETGILAKCPPALSLCEAESFITAQIPSGLANSGLPSAWQTTAKLGSVTIRLHGGERAIVRVPLSKSASALLQLRGHLRVRVELVIRAGATIIAERSRTTTLMAPSATP